MLLLQTASHLQEASSAEALRREEALAALQQALDASLAKVCALESEKIQMNEQLSNLLRLVEQAEAQHMQVRCSLFGCPPVSVWLRIVDRVPAALSPPPRPTQPHSVHFPARRSSGASKRSSACCTASWSSREMTQQCIYQR